MNIMNSWADKPYWLVADDMAYEAYNNFARQIQKRGMYEHTQQMPLFLNYCNDIKDTQLCIDFTLNLQSNPHVVSPDNLGFCLAADDYAEVEIITLLPKGYKVKTLKRNKAFHFDLLNVIRHEIEHVFQSGDFKLKDIVIEEHDRSENNFLLEPSEIPAYVHGFRISTKSNDHFQNVVRRFIDSHNKLLCLPDDEVKRTVDIWNNYLNNIYLNNLSF